MGLKDKYAKRDAEQGFEPLELNEINVRAIFNRCGKSKEDGSTDWNRETLKKNRENIRYLLGQLALVHEGVNVHEMDRAFGKRYDDTLWTGSSELLIDLLNMGRKSGFCSFFEKDSRQFVGLKWLELKPTFSPKDRKYTAWWETVDTMMVWAKVAEDEHKLDEMFSSCVEKVISGEAVAKYRCGWVYGHSESAVVAKAKALYLYEKAAEQGHRLAQYWCATMYEYGRGTTVDKAKAKMWHQKAASQTEDDEV